MTTDEFRKLLQKPTISPDELHQSGALPLTRNGIYEAIGRGELDALQFGRKYAILTAPLRRKLGLEG